MVVDEDRRSKKKEISCLPRPRERRLHPRNKFQITPTTQILTFLDKLAHKMMIGLRPMPTDATDATVETPVATIDSTPTSGISYLIGLSFFSGL